MLVQLVHPGNTRNGVRCVHLFCRGLESLEAGQLIYLPIRRRRLKSGWLSVDNGGYEILWLRLNNGGYEIPCLRLDNGGYEIPWLHLDNGGYEIPWLRLDNDGYEIPCLGVSLDRTQLGLWLNIAPAAGLYVVLLGLGLDIAEQGLWCQAAGLCVASLYVALLGLGLYVAGLYEVLWFNITRRGGGPNEVLLFKRTLLGAGPYKVLLFDRTLLGSLLDVVRLGLTLLHLMITRGLQNCTSSNLHIPIGP